VSRRVRGIVGLVIAALIGAALGVASHNFEWSETKQLVIGAICVAVMSFVLAPWVLLPRAGEDDRPTDPES
jgi:hypothetical protein